jgi:hypothetical protein
MAATRDAIWLVFGDGTVSALGQGPTADLTMSVPTRPVSVAAQGDNAYVLGANGMIYVVNDETGPKHGTVKIIANAPCDHCRH